MMNKRSSKKDHEKISRTVSYDAAIASSQTMTDDGKNAAAVALGRRGGLKGGKARAKALTAEQRSEIARLAAKTRWAAKKGKNRKKDD